MIFLFGRGVPNETKSMINLKQKYHFDYVSLDFLRLFHNTWLYIIISFISFCYVCYFYKRQETQSSIIQRNLLPSSLFHS